MADNELGLFLRSRREAVTPARVGLPAGLRRRTPGLRRAEVATLAGVSVEYLVRLEQGRDRHPSPSVLSAIADALLLVPSERVHLFRLTKAGEPGFSCIGHARPARSVRPSVQAILDHLEPAAAVVVNRLSDVLAYTEGYRRLMTPTGLLDDPATANLALFVFGNARARDFYPDWDHVADQQVAALKQGPFGMIRRWRRWLMSSRSSRVLSSRVVSLRCLVCLPRTVSPVSSMPRAVGCGCRMKLSIFLRMTISSCSSISQLMRPPLLR